MGHQITDVEVLVIGAVAGFDLRPQTPLANLWNVGDGAGRDPNDRQGSTGNPITRKSLSRANTASMRRSLAITAPTASA